MLVENQEARILGIPIREMDSLYLTPGINDVPDDDWAIAKRYRFVTDRLEGTGGLDQTLAELGASPEEGKGLKGYNQVEALSLVKRTLDLKKLGQWEDEETRRKVKAAIQKQIEILNKGRKETPETPETPTE